MTRCALRDAVARDAVPLSELFRRSSLANPGDRSALLAHPEALKRTGPPQAPARCRVATDGPEGRRVGFATTEPVPVAFDSGSVLELVDLFVDPRH